MLRYFSNYYNIQRGHTTARLRRSTQLLVVTSLLQLLKQDMRTSCQVISGSSTGAVVDFLRRPTLYSTMSMLSLLQWPSGGCLRHTCTRRLAQANAFGKISYASIPREHCHREVLSPFLRFFVGTPLHTFVIVRTVFLCTRLNGEVCPRTMQ